MHEIFPLPPLVYPHSTEPLIEVLASGYDLDAHCNNYGCNHHGRLNLVHLTRKLGPRHSSLASELTPHLHCPVCRAAGRNSKNIGLLLLPPTAYSPWPRREGSTATG